MTGRAGRGALALMVVLSVVMSVAVGGVAAAPADDLSYGGDTAAPNPYFRVDSFTVASHPVAKGLSDGAMAGIYNDNGEWVSDPGFYVNDTVPKAGVNENPYSFKPGHINDPDFGVFPRLGESNNAASALDASEWTKSGANSSKLTITDTQVAEGADAVRFQTDGTMASGDVATASYSNWTSQLDSDESKRVLQLAADINTLDSGTVVEINLTDESGDVKQVTINASATVSNDDVMATSTGDSKVIQVKLNNLATIGGGSFDNIQSLDVTITDGDFDGSFSWADLESKGKDVLGTKVVDADGDGSYDETKTIYNAQGAISVSSMTSIGSEFNNAVLNDVSFPAHFPAKLVDGSEGPEGAYQLSWDSADAYPAYDTVLNLSYRMSLPGWIDASYSGVDFVMDQNFNGERYTKFGYAEGVSDSTSFGEVSLTDISGNLGSAGETAVIDNTVQIGTGYVVTMHTKMVKSEKQAVLPNGGGAAPPTQGGGGPIDFLMSIPGMIISFGAALLGGKWLFGK